MEIGKILGFSLIFSLLTWFIIERLVKYYIRKEAEIIQISYFTEVTYLAWFAGFLEIIMYCASILIKKPEFIAVWLGFKTAISWNRERKEWNCEPKEIEKGKGAEKEIQAEQNGKSRDTKLRGNYLSVITGSSLNIIFAILIIYIIKGECFFNHY